MKPGKIKYISTKRLLENFMKGKLMARDLYSGHYMAYLPDRILVRGFSADDVGEKLLSDFKDLPEESAELVQIAVASIGLLYKVWDGNLDVKFVLCHNILMLPEEYEEIMAKAGPINQVITKAEYMTNRRKSWKLK